MSDEAWPRGAWVKVVGGRKARGARGVIFWAEHVTRYYHEEEGYIGWRVGFQDEEGKKHYINAPNLTRIVPPKPVAPDKPIQKGDRVRWLDGSSDGAGVVFWCGPNKFGPGIRVGLKDDASGATMWLDARQVIPEIQDGLAHLRGLFHDEPSEALWTQILDAFEAWPAGDATLSIALTYAQEHLERWPDTLRVLPAAWVERITSGRDIPGLPLVRSCTLRGDPGQRPGGVPLLQALLGSTLDKISIVDLSYQLIGQEGVRLLLRSSWAPHLRHLTLVFNAINAKAARMLLTDDALRGLVTLDLRDNRLGGTLKGLMDGVSKPNLEHLMLPRNLLALEGEELLLSGVMLPAARTPYAQNLTVAQLQAVAKKLGLRGYTKLKKAKLVEVVVAALSEPK